jgi:hypothetical protein
MKTFLVVLIKSFGKRTRSNTTPHEGVYEEVLPEEEKRKRRGEQTNSL